MTGDALNAWLERGAAGRPNWLLIANVLAHARSAMLLRAPPRAWTAWLGEASRRLGHSPAVLRRMLACRQALADAPELARFVTRADPVAIGDPSGQGALCALPVFVVELLARLKRVAPERYDEVLFGERALGRPLTATRLRAALEAGGAPARGRLIRPAGHPLLRAAGAALALLQPGAREVSLLEDYRFRQPDPVTALALGLAGGAITSCDLLILDPARLDEDYLRAATCCFDRLWIVAPREAEDRLAPVVSLLDRLAMGSAGVALVGDGRLEPVRVAVANGRGEALRHQILTRSLAGLAGVWPDEATPEPPLPTGPRPRRRSR